MAIFYENEKNDRKEIYDAAKKWKDECLLNDRSLIWDGETIWSDENLQRFKAVFVENPNESGDGFDSKLKKQLENESESVYKLAIEIMFIYYLFPGSITYPTKMKKLKMIASWKEIELDQSLPIFNALKRGLGATGTFYNTSKYFEISFLFLVVEKLKNQSLVTREEIINNEKELKRLADDTRRQVGKRVQMLHIFLHLLLPQYFERIASWGHKGRIVKAFSDYISDPSKNDMDEKLYLIRETLQAEYPDETIDFYGTREILKKWRGDTEQEEVSPAIVEDALDSMSPVDFEGAGHIQEGLVFEEFDLLVEQIKTAIKNGKHIILTGPPGTGKSKLASKICEMYQVDWNMVTAASNWSTYETIGGYRPDKNGNLYFNPGIFLNCVKEKQSNQPVNKWLIIDEINRADIDKAFGPLFSVLTGDTITLPFESESGNSIVLKPQKEINTVETDDSTYVIPKDWRMIGTMNTVDKASLYEMSYAFMRRFAFIPVGIPKEITVDLIQQYVEAWNMGTYPNVDVLTVIWKLINQYRKIGPAIIKDIAQYTQDNDDFTSALILYVLPQFEGLPPQKIYEFIDRVVEQTEVISDKNYLKDFVADFFDTGGLE